MNVILIGIFIILLLDFYMKYGSIIKKKFKKTKQKIVKKDIFSVRTKGYGDKVIDDLDKIL